MPSVAVAVSVASLVPVVAVMLVAAVTTPGVQSEPVAVVILGVPLEPVTVAWVVPPAP